MKSSVAMDVLTLLLLTNNLLLGTAKQTFDEIMDEYLMEAAIPLDGGHMSKILLFNHDWNYCVGVVTGGTMEKGKGVFKCDPLGLPYVYSGEFENQQFNGFGIQHYLYNGFVYKGDFRNSSRHGNGAALFPNGGYHWGEWAYNQVNGFGEALYLDGTYYNGQWLMGKFHGWGSKRWPDGLWMQGQWENDTLHGHGLAVWPDGCRSEGQFVNSYHVNGEDAMECPWMQTPNKNDGECEGPCEEESSGLGH